jgi:hypothetical protein
LGDEVTGFIFGLSGKQTHQIAIVDEPGEEEEQGISGVSKLD